LKIARFTIINTFYASPMIKNKSSKISVEDERVKEY